MRRAPPRQECECAVSFSWFLLSSHRAYWLVVAAAALQLELDAQLDGADVVARSRRRIVETACREIAVLVEQRNPRVGPVDDVVESDFELVAVGAVARVDAG